MNMVKRENQNKRFFNIVAGVYDRGIVGKWLFGIIEKTIKEVNIDESSKILDVGTGTGNLLAFLEKKNKKLDLYGIDISEKMLSVARKKVRYAHFFKLSVLDINKKFKESSFDYIFVIDAFHHFPEQEEVMHNFHKILKNRGALIITELDFGRVFNYLFHILEPGNQWIYTKRQMRNLFIESMFTIKKQKKIGLFSYITIGTKVKPKRRIK